MAAAAITSLQAGEKRGISTGILFYIYFIPLYFCVAYASEGSISEYPMVIELPKLELHIRSFKIPGLILGQSKSEARPSLVIFCLQPKLHIAETERTTYGLFLRQI